MKAIRFGVRRRYVTRPGRVIVTVFDGERDSQHMTQPRIHAREQRKCEPE
jgi:hypothetical protein